MKKIIKIFLTVTIVVSLLIGTILMVYPLQYKEYVNKYAKQYDIDPLLIMAIIKTESNFESSSISLKNARGLMQIGESTGEWAGEVLDVQNYSTDVLFEPEINIMIGTWYFTRLFEQYNNIDLASAAYNAGSGNVSYWLTQSEYSSNSKTLDYIPFKETREYVSKVNSNYKIYKTLYKTSINNVKDSALDEIIIEFRRWVINFRRKYN